MSCHVEVYMKLHMYYYMCTHVLFFEKMKFYFIFYFTRAFGFLTAAPGACPAPVTRCVV